MNDYKQKTLHQDKQISNQKLVKQNLESRIIDLMPKVQKVTMLENKMKILQNNEQKLKNRADKYKSELQMAQQQVTKYTQANLKLKADLKEQKAKAGSHSGQGNRQMGGDPMMPMGMML